MPGIRGEAEAGFEQAHPIGVDRLAIRELPVCYGPPGCLAPGAILLE